MRYKIEVETKTDSYTQSITFLYKIHLENWVRTDAFTMLGQPLGAWSNPSYSRSGYSTAAEAVAAAEAALAPYLEFCRAWLARVEQAKGEARRQSYLNWVEV